MRIDLSEKVEEITEGQDFAIGNDLVFLPDFEKSFNLLFKKRVYTQKEIDYCDQFDNPILRYASTWAAKEAVYKSIKQIIPKAISFKKIEITRSKIGGKPSVVLPELYKNLKLGLSLTHDGDYVWAVVILKLINN
ncbi:holo-ACP synthase [Pedobacter sp. SD-b]|uniref:Holo-[acyl-carrier-protein] synthase n=2 Tax=Pedobacter segetis TaxID=2793069 RepID=A0ABS1BJY3_9SPHI|nr:holo-ACP synthase [Pedobacter segetis]